MVAANVVGVAIGAAAGGQTVEVLRAAGLGPGLAFAVPGVAAALLAEEDLLDVLDELLEPETLGLRHDRLADLVLEAGVSVDDVPAGHWENLVRAELSRGGRAASGR